jgi:serine/threonine protein kinase
MTSELREGSPGDSVRSALEALGPGFELIRELGRGATAIVYLVKDHELNRDLAVKVIRSSFGADEEAMARLQREAQLVARLQHPNIVKLYGTRHLPDGSMVLLMEHVPGRNLKELIQDTGPLPPRRAMSFLRDVTSALAYAHRRRIVHRDVKPENIYIDDEVGTARLADFGVARPWDLDTRLTLPGESLGTPAYMAPEQIDGQDVDGRSDVFSLGLVAYEMLTGAHPWEGESIYSIIFKQKQEEPPLLREVRPDLSDRVIDIVERAIRKDPADRWESAEEMLAALEALADPEVDPLLHGLGLDEEAPLTTEPSLPGHPSESRGAVESRPPVRATAPTRGAPSKARGGSRRRRALLLLGAGVLLLATAWQPLGLGRWLPRSVDAEDIPLALPPTIVPPAPADTGPPPIPGTPRILAGRGGNAQSGPVGTVLPEQLEVQVLDSAGTPVPAVSIVFEIVGGSGILASGEAVTDSMGSAATLFTLPETPQDIEVVARLAEAPELESRFLVSALPRTGTAVGGVDGDDQTGRPGEPLSEALLLRVVDDEGQPVEGAEVEFATESGSVQPEVDLTNADGWAVARWTLGDELGPQELVARIPGGGARVVFNANAAEPEPEPEPDSVDVPDDPIVLGPAPASVVRRGWDVGGTMVCVLGAGGRPFCRGGTSASEEVGGIVAVAAGVTHACGLDETGRAYCWGSNPDGQLGDGSRSSHDGRPVDGSLRFSRLAAGLAHTCGLDASGAAHCWGGNLSGQLGTGGRDDRTVPVSVATPLRFTRIVSGWNHTCALTPSGQIHCWGLNSAGQLGDGGRLDRLAPVPVTSGAGFQALAAGSGHTCALRDGQVYCWGDNQHGQLGNGTVQAVMRPGPVGGLPPVASVVAGASHTCARATTGEVFCWGQNIHGQLGDGTNQGRSVPAPVSGDLLFSSIYAGGGITCGRSTEGDTWCWGFNQSGQLGDGSRTSRSVPTRVGG